MKPVELVCEVAATTEQAWQLWRAASDSKWLGGGQSLGPMLNLRLARPARLVQLNRIAALQQVTSSATSVCYGAMLRHADFEDGRVEDGCGGMLRYVASGIAYRAVRNLGTLGGSLAHADPAADWMSCMMALNATLLTCTESEQRRHAAEGFMQAAFTTRLQAGEMIVAIEVPRLSAAARWGYAKFCRKSGEFSEATAAVVADPPRAYARVVLGAVDGPPLLLEGLADRLAEAGVAAALADSDAQVNACTSGLAESRRQLCRAMVRRALAQLEETR